MFAPESADEQPNCLMKDTDKLHVGLGWSIALWAVCVELEHLEHNMGEQTEHPHPFKLKTLRGGGGGGTQVSCDSDKLEPTPRTSFLRSSSSVFSSGASA